jgi:predicted O-methyltransferase YrrM
MKYLNPEIESSYKENNLGKTLYDLVITSKPEKIIEFGVLNGYSTVAMAMALDELGKGHIVGYDLFKKYQFKNSSITDTQKNIDSYKLSDYVTLKEGDFESWIKNPEPFDFMHIDISNTGDTIEKLYKAVKPQIEKGSIVVFEGGTDERDNVEWMIKYNKKRIKESGVPYEVLNPLFPGISKIILK